MTATDSDTDVGPTLLVVYEMADKKKKKK